MTPTQGRPSLYEAAGGGDAMLRLARAHHARCLADPELNHPFSHPGQHPEHNERLASYWGEVLGGPPAYTDSCGTESEVLAMHSGNGDLSDLNRRFVDCFVASFDEAGIPDDPELRGALAAYMQWAVEEFNRWPTDAGAVPAGLTTPRWTWDGPVRS